MEIRVLMGRVTPCDNLRDQHAAASAAGQELLRRLLSQALPGEEVEIAKTGLGKPFLPAHPELGVSISHSGDFAVAAMGRGPVGIDLERLRDPMPGALAKYFTESEREMVAAGGGEVFTRLWTTKEAIGKALGTGISNRALFQKSNRALLAEYSFAAHSIAVPPGYVCTLVAGNKLRNPPKCVMIKPNPEEKEGQNREI